MIKMFNEDGSLIIHKYDDGDDQYELCHNTSYCSIHKNGFWLETKTSANPRTNQAQQEDGSSNTCSLIQRNRSQLNKEEPSTSGSSSLESISRFKEKKNKEKKCKSKSESNATPERSIKQVRLFHSKK